MLFVLYILFSVDLKGQMWFNIGNAACGECKEKQRPAFPFSQRLDRNKEHNYRQRKEKSARDKMGTGGKKLKKKVLSILLSASMILTMSGMTALAGSAEKLDDVTQEREAAKENALRLWYDKPSSQGAGNGDWQQCTLPIGNGDMGANIYGEIVNEHLTFNEKTLWTGGPSTSRPDYNGGNLENVGREGALMKEIQQLFAEGKATDATNKCNTLIGAGSSAGYGSYQAWGDIYFDYQGITAENATEYVRDLDLCTAVSTVSYKVGSTQYKREYFISNPDNVLAARLSAEGSDKLNLNVRFTSKQGASAVASGDSLVVAGAVSDNQLKYDSVLRVANDGGSVTAREGQLEIRDASAITVYVSAATDYKNDYPAYRTGESAEQLHERVKADVDAAFEKGYDTVKADHISDYSELFSRVELDLGAVVSDKPTDELLTAYQNKTATEAERRQLETMLFQYGRYLTLGSSRENSQLPSNLQGVWNNSNSPSWSSDYHMNVNLQMNYWPAYSTNLAECAKPLISYVDSLREPGRETARIYAGIESTEENPENGFMAHTQNTPFGWTCPGWAFSWGWSPAAVPWILQNCWDYYDFTGDVDYLKNNIYPMMKEEATLYDQMLIEDADGKLVSSPTYSPEHGPYTSGNTYEQSLIWQLYEDTITAAGIVGETDTEKIRTWKSNQENLKGPIEIGDDGQIKEWYTETTLGSAGGQGYGHRHLSHMLGLFPGDLISEETPEWFEAAKVSMNNRTDSSTGWGMGQRINTWARLGDGNRAYKLITDLFASGIYQNLWDTHPPFQIDGNFGYTSGVAEMLLQSNMGYINLLPALPDNWSEGRVDGLVARGNFELNMNWSKGLLSDVTILSKNGGEAVVQYEDIFLASVTDENGKEIEITKISDDRISFDTEKGKSYRIREIPGDAKVSAPSGLRAEREGNEAVLSWNAVEADKVAYNIYRQIGEGDLVKIAEGITGTQYTDEKSYQVFDTVTYQVSTVSNGVESELSEGISLANCETIDDRDAKVSYNGEWKDWDDASNYNGTIKYLQTPNGGETATLNFNGTGISVLTCLNHDRGKLEITIDTTTYGVVDTYSPSTQRQYEVFSVMDLAPGDHTLVVKATNTKNESSSNTKVELDGFKIWNIRMPELPEGEKSQTLAAETNRVMVQWEATDGADSYNIYGADGTKLATASNSYAWVECLEAEKSYTFVIKAVTADVESAASVEVKAATLAKEPEQGEGTAPEKVSELQAVKGADDTQAKLTWKAAEGAAKYEIWMAGKLEGTTAATEYVLTGLTKGQKYTVKIVAVSLQNKKSAVAGVSFTAGSLSEPEKPDIPKPDDSKPDISKPDDPKPDNSKPEQPSTVTEPKEGEILDGGNFNYKVTSASAMTVEAVKLKNTKLTKLKIGNEVKLSGKTYKVTGIAASVFKGNKKITSVSIGKNVETIGNNAFAGCTKLIKVTISGNGLKKIGAKAFSGCKKLKNITIKSKKLKAVGKNAFKNIHAKAVIKVPKAKYKVYKKLLAKKGQKKNSKN